MIREHMKTRNGIGFFVGWLCMYLVVINAATLLSQAVGIDHLFPAIFSSLFAVIMVRYLKRHDLLAYYGLRCKQQLNSRKLLYGLPFMIYASSNLWHGIAVNETSEHMVLITIGMLCVGFIEEMIFRAFLMKAIDAKHDVTAVFVSAFLFGFLHILNILGGADLFHTVLQVLNTTAFGFMCAAFYCKTNHIWPCILSHSIYNAFDTLIPLHASATYLTETIVILMSFLYGFYLMYKG